ncbi:MAG: hypothetical protein JSS35_14545, partial [Proteobacteria bacterium]|nr:hypothetical protein [Pseudomonadota bacterium]
MLVSAALLAFGRAAALAQTPPSPRDAAHPVVVPTLPAPAERPWLDTSRPAAERARLLVAAMALEEKVSLLSGAGLKVQNGQLWQVYMRGIPRLGIPDMTQGDTPNGLFIGGPDVVQMPNESALAA